MTRPACPAPFPAVLLVLLSIAPRAHAAVDEILTKEARDRLGRIAVLDNHRVKPFDTFSRETVKAVTGDEKFGGADPIETVLSWAAHAPDHAKEPLVRVKKERLLKERLGIAAGVERVSYDTLDPRKNAAFAELAMAARSKEEKERSTLENQAFETWIRFSTLESVFFGTAFRAIPGPGDDPLDWHALADAEGLGTSAEGAAAGAWQSFFEAYASGDGSLASRLVLPLAAALRSVNPAGYPSEKTIGYEVTLNRTKPFFLATWTYFLACALFLGSFIGPAKLFRRAAIAVVLLAAVFHLGGMTLRILAAGRPPVTNIPETLFWISFGVILFAMIFELITKNRYFGLAGTALAGLGLLYFSFCPFPTGINQIAPVLRSNYWLTVHVLTVVISYAALLLAGMLGAIHIWGRVFNAQSRAASATLMQCLFPAIHIGVLLLAAGTILGGVWANESWGRYWGWDPKETWALITLLWFLAIVHGRIAGYRWFKGLAVSGATVFGAGLTLFTWWGVNFIPWFVGLHTYAGVSAEEFRLADVPMAAKLATLAVVGTLLAAAAKGFLSRGAAAAGEPSQPDPRAANAADSREGKKPARPSVERV